MPEMVSEVSATLVARMTLRRGEGAALLAGGKRGEERYYVVGREAAREVVGGFADVALAGEKHEHVAVRRKREERRFHVARKVALFVLRRRHITHLDREEPPGDFDFFRVFEKRGEASGVERRRGDDNFQVFAAFQRAFEDAEQEIDVE